MGLIDSLGGLQKTRQKTANSDKSIEDIIQDSIDIQKRMLNGEDVKTSGGKTSVRSWFRNGQMTVVVSNLNFFGEGLSLDMGSSTAQSVLEMFEKEFKSGDMKQYISDFSKRKDERDIKLRNRTKK